MGWAGMAMQGVGQGLGFLNNWETMNKEDDAAAQDYRDQEAAQQQINNTLNAGIAKRASSSDAGDIANAQQQYATSLAQHAAEIQQGTQQPGAVSSGFKNDANAAALGTTQYANTAADLMSRMDAPQYQRQREGMADDTLGTNVGILSNDARGQHFLDQLKLHSIHPNPWITFISQALQQGGQAMGGGMGGG